MCKSRFILGLIVLTISGCWVEVNQETPIASEPQDFESSFTEMVTSSTPQSQLVYQDYLERHMMFFNALNNQMTSIEVSTSNDILISPDNRKISFLDNANSLQIVDYSGNLEQFDLDSQNGRWHIWGWASSTSLIISHEIDEEIQFFTLDVTNLSEGTIPNSRLTEFVNQYITNRLDGHSSEAYQLLRFDPTFNYVIAPSGKNEIGLIEEIALIWDLSKSLDEPSTSIERVFPWWYPSTLYSLSWSTDSKLVFAVFDDTDCPINLMIFNASDQTQTALSEITCNSDYPDSYPAYLSWSHDLNSIAYWERSGPSGGDIQKLVIIENSEEANQVVVFETNQLPVRRISWSTDDLSIAFTYSNLISILDLASDETILLTINSDSELIGWVTQ